MQNDIKPLPAQSYPADVSNPSDTFNNFPKQEELKLDPKGYDLGAESGNKDVPSFSMVSKNKLSAVNYCNQDVTGRGLFIQARKKEREELRQMFIDMGVPTSEVDFICYIPNAKLGWFNATIKQAFRNVRDGKTTKPTISLCDASSMFNMWMNPESRTNLETFIKKYFAISNEIPNIYAIPPTKGPPLVCQLNNGRYNPGIRFRNPGVMEFSCNNNMKSCCQSCADGEICTKDQLKWKGCDQRLTKNFKDLFKHIQNTIVDEDPAEFHDHVDLSQMDDRYISLLQNMRHFLNTKKITLREVEFLTDQLHSLKADASNLYLASILFPERITGARIPQQIPISSATFKLKANATLTTNALGNVAAVYTPFALFAAGFPTSSIAVNNHVSLNGQANNDNFYAINIGQTLPGNFYSRYRLVSAELRITFTASSFTSSGFCTTSISYDVDATPFATTGQLISPYAPYGDFQRVENGQYKSSMAAAQGNQTSLLYLPQDNNFTEFRNTSTTLSNYAMCLYVSGAPASTPVARLDIYANYEAIVDNDFADYIPSTNIKSSHDAASRTYQAISLITPEHMIDPYKRDKLLKDIAPTQSIDKNVKIDLPLSTIEKRHKKGFLDYVGDLALDAAKTIIPMALPIGGNLVKDLLFPQPIKQINNHLNDTVSLEDFPEAGKAILQSKPRPLYA